MNKEKAMKKAIAVLLAALASYSMFAAHTEVTKAPRLPFQRGVNFRGYYDALQDTTPVTRSHHVDIRNKGFDHVRLPVDFRRYMNYDSTTHVATFKSSVSTIDTVLDLAEETGLYVMISGTHIWKEADLDPRDAAVTNQFIALWKAVAERYKDRSNKIIFELMSEQGVPGAGVLAHEFAVLQNNAVKEIRKTNPTRLIIWSSPDGSQAWTLTQGKNPPDFSWIELPKDDNNIFVAIHCYNPPEFALQGAWAQPQQTTMRLTDEHRETLRWEFQQCKRWLDGTGMRLAINEFGACHKKGVADHGDVVEFDSMLTRWCEENKVPWTPWVYSLEDNWYLRKKDGSWETFVLDGLFPDFVHTYSSFPASDYAKSIDISFPGYSGATSLTNFPVLVRLSEDAIYGFHYADFARPNGWDLRFTDANGNLIPHEIETWNTSGESTVWVKVPSLTASTKITAHYGCAKPVVPKVESVWDENYVGVWHMGEQKLPLADSSNVSRDVTSADGTGIGYGFAGLAGGAVDFGAANSSRSVNMDDHRELDGFKKLTVEAWTKQDAHTANAGIVSKRKGAGSQTTFYMYDDGSGTTMGYSTDGSSVASAGIRLQPVMGRWNHQVYSVDTTASASNSKAYLNGSLKGTQDVALSGGLFAGASELHVGNLDAGGAVNFPGQIDEVRISKCVRSADWVKASYETMAKDGFATYAVRGAGTPAADAREYAHSVAVSFTGYAGGETLADFPVLVRLSESIDGFSYADFSLPNAADLRFFDAAGNMLAHEVDTWNSNGVSTVWVKVPTLDASTAIYAKYGCAWPASARLKSDVWTSGYLGVWHLGESGFAYSDSTAGGKGMVGSSNYSAYMQEGAAGAVGGAVELATTPDPDGKYRGGLAVYDSDSRFSNRPAVTVEVWGRQRDLVNDRFFLMKRKSSVELPYNARLALSSEGRPQMCYTVRMTNTVSNTGKTYASLKHMQSEDELNVWNHHVLVVDNEVAHRASVYFNGSQETSQALDAGLTLCADGADLVFGNSAITGSQAFPGGLDEIRVSGVPRSADWIKATHDTVMKSDFATYAMDSGTTEPPEPQYVFAHEVSVAFSGYSGGEDLTDFPVLVRLSANIPGFSYEDFQIENGGDLRFFDADGNLLSHEIDTWNPNGVSTAWVKVPTLNADTVVTERRHRRHCEVRLRESSRG